MTDSTTPAKPEKPRPDFPLFPHASGRWAKKIRGKLHYFGSWRTDPQGEKAIARWLDEKDALLAGRTPRPKTEGLTVGQLVNAYLRARKPLVATGELHDRTWRGYSDAGARFIAFIGRDRLIDDLEAGDFEAMRADYAKGRGPVSLANYVQAIRTICKWAYDNHLVATPVRYGSGFKKPSLRVLRLERQKRGKKMFEADELRRILDAAPQPLYTMTLLGANCGFGSADIGRLPIDALDLINGWVRYPRFKTAVERSCKLWPETISAIQDWLPKRPEPTDPAHKGLVFITRRGGLWYKEGRDDSLCKEFAKLLDRIDAKEVEAAAEENREPLPPLRRPGRLFYSLRHGVETIGGACKDQPAVDHCMGHTRNDMASVYRESIEPERLVAVTDTIHAWLWPKKNDEAVVQ